MTDKDSRPAGESARPSYPPRNDGRRERPPSESNPPPARGISPLKRMAMEALAVYAVAGLIVWLALRQVNFSQVARSLEGAHFPLFIAATLASFLIFFFGENLLFARMFSYFHAPTGYRELLPATAADYFLQAVNILVANLALLLFLRRRKGVGWFAAGFTMTFFGFIDGLVFSSSIVAAGLLVPDSKTGEFVPYAAIALASFLLIAAWWLWRTPTTRFERWLHDRPSLVSFRNANLAIYGNLLAIRFAILVPQGICFWLCMRAFGMHVALAQVMALTPLIFGVTGLPVTPAGLGFLQAVAVDVFAGLAPTASVFAMSLAFSVARLLYRIPLGLGSAHVFARMVIRGGGQPQLETAPLGDPAADRRA